MAAITHYSCSRMGLADEVLAADCADLDAWDREHVAELSRWAGLPDEAPVDSAVREACQLRAMAQPVVQFAISLRYQMPGAELERDAVTHASAALSRRTAWAFARAGLDKRLVQRNLRLLDRVDELLGQWPEPEWSDAVRNAVQRLSEARRAGRARGQHLRQTGRFPDPAPPSLGWLLRHPGDHWFRRARPAITDPKICTVVDEWIADSDASYATLAATQPTADSADVVVDVALPDEYVAADSHGPVSTVLLASHQGNVEIDSSLPLHLVAPGEAVFNGTIIAVLAGERWRIVGTLLADGSLLPADGTYRLQVSAS